MLSERTKYLGFVLASIILVAFYLWKSYTFQIHDFANYYLGAKAILANNFTPDIYDALHFNQLFEDVGINKLFVNFYPNTPFIAIAYLPLSYFDWPEAKLIHNIIGASLFLLALCRLFSYYKLNAWHYAIIIILTAVAIKNTLLFGQTYFLIFFLLAEGLLSYEKNRKPLAALLWSLAILIKVFPIIILFWLFFRKDFATICYIFVTCGLLILASSLFISFETLHYYFADVFPSSSAGLIYDGFTVQAKSAVMLFKNTFVKDELLNPSPFITSTFLYTLSFVLYKSLIFALAASATRLNKTYILYSFSLWVIAGLLIAPTSSSYSKLILIIPILSLFQYKIKQSTLLIILTLLFFVTTFPTHYLINLALPFNFIKILLLFTVFVLISGLHTYRMPFNYVVGFIIVFSIQGFSNKNLTSAYQYFELNHKPPLIMSNLKIVEGELQYYYWSITGETLRKTGIQVSTSSTNDVNVTDNQIYYKNRQLTNTKDKKISPYIINESTVIFLTDTGRAPGCYTIRKLNI